MPKTKPNVFDGQSITADEFFRTHWQRLPYLFTNTSLDLSCLPDAETLFALANQEDVQSRIIYTEDERRYLAIYDDPDAWDEVIKLKPTLLVSDIEKWNPSASQLLRWFPFIKNWRFDDLMMSYAPAGASVGAHTDHYDVFLVQVKGTRQWSYNEQPLKNAPMVEDSELAVIDSYQAKISHELKPGDVLYLPPEVPHHGISTSDDCITCSIGLRAPSQAELLGAVIELASEDMSDEARFKDAVDGLNSTSAIGPHEINYLRAQLETLSHASDDELASHFGRFVTGYRLFDEVPLDNNPAKNQPSQNAHWQKSPFAVFAYHPTSKNEASLFVNGEAFPCNLDLAATLCDQNQFQLSALKTAAEDHHEMSTHRLLNHLVSTQALIPTK